MACFISTLTSGAMHGETPIDRHGTGCAGAGFGYRSEESGRFAMRASGVVARDARRDACLLYTSDAADVVHRHAVTQQ